MSTTAVVFFGLKFELADDEIDDVELRTDQRVRRARAHRLDHYDGRFATGDGVRHLLLIGKKLASSDDELPMQETREKLIGAGWSDEPRLMVLFEVSLRER